MNSTLAALRQFVHREYDQQIRETRSGWNRPLAERIARGTAIGRISVRAVNRPFAELTCPINLSKFRPGEYLILHRGNPEGAEAYRCRLDRDRDTRLRIREGYQTFFDRKISGNGWILDKQSMDLRSFILGALDQLADGSSRSDRILKILQGRTLPNFDSFDHRQVEEIAKRAGFNPSQREAFQKGLSARNYHLIQGPPGTGKTYLLAWLAVTLARQGQRVLVTAFTHRAINNALRKIGRLGQFDRVAKIGQTYRAVDLKWSGGQVPNYEYADHCPYADVRGAILGGTCFSLRTNRLSGVEFDTVIFDEAGQLPLTLAAAGMLAGDRYLFIGDHQQMAPIITAEHDQDWVTRSVFESLIQHHPGTMLDITYRMNEEINRFPSQRFYGGKLKPAPEAAGRTLTLQGDPGKFRSFLEPQPSSLFIEVDHSGDSMRAEKEAELAAGITAEAVRRGLPETEIAVIAPYRAQGRLIRNALNKLGVEVGGEAVVVDTVERIQGQERDVIIFSLTTSDPVHAAERADFFFQPNRLNVAITRPRVKRIVIGDPGLFRAVEYTTKYRTWVEHFHGLYQESEIFQWDSGKH